MKTPRRALTPAERLAHGNLRRIWDEKKGELKLTQEGVAHRLSWKNQSAVSQYLNGSIPLNTEAVLKFAGVLQVAPSVIDPRVQDLLPISSAQLLHVAETPGVYDAGNPIGQDRYVFVNKVRGVRYESGTGGISWDHEEVDRSHAFQRDFIQKMGWDLARLKILKNHGNSNAPWIMDGDAVMIHLRDNKILESDDPTKNVFAIQYGEHSRFKRIVPQHDGSVLLRSFNPDKQTYPDERVAGDELDSLAIIGRVVWRGG